MTRRAPLSILFALAWTGLSHCTSAREPSRTKTSPECPRELPAPNPLPGSRPEHRQFGFWIGKLPHPDSLILRAEAIGDLNRRWEVLGDSGGRNDVLSAAVAPSPLLAHMAQELRRLRAAAEAGALVTLSSLRPETRFFQSLETIARSYEPSSHLRYVRRVAELRCQPTTSGLYELPVDPAFDQLLCSTLRPGEVVRDVSRHKEGWLLVRTAYASGWVHEDDVSEPMGEAAAARYLRSPSFAVVNSDGAAVWDSAEGLHPVGGANVGLRLPLVSTDAIGDRLHVLWPGRDGLVDGWVDRDDVHVGSVPLTQRNLLRQAFRMLDQPYAWGGRGGGRDCSSFLMDLFAVFGLNLPRHSAAQAAVVGSQAIDVPPSFRLPNAEGSGGVAQLFDQILDSDPPRAALLHLDGHIMLLVGRDGADYYAIHDFSGYRVACQPGRDIKMAVDRVAVTSLRLGEGSERGSFASRLDRIVLIGKPWMAASPAGF